MRYLWLIVSLTLVSGFAAAGEFGSIDTSSSPDCLTIDSWFRGSVATSNGAGTLDSVCFILRHSGAEVTQVRCALYFVGDSSLVDSTYHRALDLDATVKVWFTFVNGASITDATDYVAVVQGNANLCSLRSYLSDSGPVWRGSDLLTYSVWPNSIDPTIVNNYYYSFLVTYTTPPAEAGQVIIIQH